MRFSQTPLDGAWLIELEPRADARGYLARTFCAEEFAAHGLPPAFVQANETLNRDRGTLRGMHWQSPPHAETKLVRCTQGRVFDVIVDLREDSPTYRRWHGVELAGGDGRQLFVPAGFAHGYLTLAPETVLTYLMGAPYSPQAAKGFRYDDPAIGIAWPLEADPVLSERDRAWPALAPVGRPRPPGAASRPDA